MKPPKLGGELIYRILKNLHPQPQPHVNTPTVLLSTHFIYIKESHILNPRVNEALVGWNETSLVGNFVRLFFKNNENKLRSKQ